MGGSARGGLSRLCFDEVGVPAVGHKEHNVLVNKVLPLCLVAGFSTAALAQESGDPRRGLAYAQAVCASCHAVLPAEHFSPRSGTATFKAIANTPGMTGTAISVWLRTPHRSMPDLIIEPRDQHDVIAYILSLRDKGPTN